MADRFEQWQNEAPKWISELDGALSSCSSDDVVLPYCRVALAFPSPMPNELSFDSPLIDHDQLRQWASARGWRIRPASDMAAKGTENRPPVRFTKQT